MAGRQSDLAAPMRGGGECRPAPPLRAQSCPDRLYSLSCPAGSLMMHQRAARRNSSTPDAAGTETKGQIQSLNTGERNSARSVHEQDERKGQEQGTSSGIGGDSSDKCLVCSVTKRAIGRTPAAQHPDSSSNCLFVSSSEPCTAACCSTDNSSLEVERQTRLPAV